MSHEGRTAQRALAVVRSAEESTSPRVMFCGHCGATPEPTEASRPQQRVCESCSLGVLLECAEDVAPRTDSAFIVIDGSLSVCAVSRVAEGLLATRETEAVNRHITELVVPADAEAQGPENLAVAVTWAARGDDSTRQVVVRPANTFGIRLSARIASCGPPRAALLVFD
jgi:hypothetical protein